MAFPIGSANPPVVRTPQAMTGTRTNEFIRTSRPAYISQRVSSRPMGRRGGRRM